MQEIMSVVIALSGLGITILGLLVANVADLVGFHIDPRVTPLPSLSFLRERGNCPSFVEESHG